MATAALMHIKYFTATAILLSFAAPIKHSLTYIAITFFNPIFISLRTCLKKDRFKNYIIAPESLAISTTSTDSCSAKNLMSGSINPP